MDGPGVRLEPAGDALEYVESLLERNGLPSADVRSKREWFAVAYRGPDRVGVGGVEVHGAAGLLRSVAVEQSARGEGVGTALCDALESEAAADGVESLFLLTTTAAEFFAGRGYEEIERVDAPDAIRQTTEFDELCPASATCMRKRLERRS
jgi:amino-acid N-acetyltransferase